MSLDWKGNSVLDQVARRLIPAVDEIDMRIEGTAKEQLYPGHGKVSGDMQRGIQARAAHRTGDRVIGSVGVRGVPYALRQHRRYRYIVIGFERWRGAALSIIRKHAAR